MGRRPRGDRPRDPPRTPAFASARKRLRAQAKHGGDSRRLVRVRSNCGSAHASRWSAVVAHAPTEPCTPKSKSLPAIVRSRCSQAPLSNDNSTASTSGLVSVERDHQCGNVRPPAGGNHDALKGRPKLTLGRQWRVVVESDVAAIAIQRPLRRSCRTREQRAPTLSPHPSTH
jgi:hypothetical protein